MATFLWVFAAVNALLVAASLIPIDLKVGQGTIRSDGKLLLDAYRTGSMAPAPPEVIQAAAGLRPLWESIGDRRINRAFALAAASWWIDLGSPDRAEPLVAGSTTFGGTHPHLDWLEAFVRANLAIAQGEAAGARAALDRAESLADPASPEGRFLLDLLRANLLLAEGGPGLAGDAFAKLALDPAGRDRPALELSPLSGHLRAACLAGDRDTVAGLRERYLGRRRPPSDLHNLHVFGPLARFTQEPEDCRLAINAVAALAARWRDPADRAGFLEAQRGLIEAARGVLGDDGLPSFEPSGAPGSGSPLRGHDRTLRRGALWLMLLNGVSVAALALLAAALGRPPAMPASLLAEMLALFTLAGVVYLLLDFAIGKLFPSRKWSGGFVLFALAALPWAFGLMFGVFAALGL